MTKSDHMCKYFYYELLFSGRLVFAGDLIILQTLNKHSFCDMYTCDIAGLFLISGNKSPGPDHYLLTRGQG